MSEDLVKRLRTPVGFQDLPFIQEEAAGRIEELELEVETWKSRAIHQNEVAGRLEAKLSKSEALLAKAVEALEFYATQDVTYPNVGTVTFHGHDDNGCKARATLAELTGGKDE